MPLMLMTSPELEQKYWSIEGAVGERQAVMIKYRIHSRSVFARIRAKERAGEEAEEDDFKGVLLDIWIP